MTKRFDMVSSISVKHSSKLMFHTDRRNGSPTGIHRLKRKDLVHIFFDFILSDDSNNFIGFEQKIGRSIYWKLKSNMTIFNRNNYHQWRSKSKKNFSWISFAVLSSSCICKGRFKENNKPKPKAQKFELKRHQNRFCDE